MTTNTVRDHNSYSPFLNQYYQSKIITTVALVGAGVSTTYAILLLTLYDNLFSCLSDLAFATIYLITIYFIRQNKTAFSTYWIVFWAGIQVSVGSALFVGANTGFQLYFLTLPVLIYFLLWQEPLWARTSVIAYGVILFIISHTVYVPTFQANIDKELANTIFIANALIVFAITFLAVKFFADEIEKAYKSQERLVLTDRETNLPNARFIEEHAKHILAQCDRYGHPFSLLNIALQEDNNVDKQLIQMVSNLLQDNCREADILARTQDLQFTLLLPETSASATQKLITRIIEQHSNKSSTHKTLRIKFGSAYCDSHSMLSIDELMNNAKPEKAGSLRL